MAKANSPSTAASIFAAPEVAKIIEKTYRTYGNGHDNPLAKPFAAIAAKEIGLGSPVAGNLIFMGALQGGNQTLRPVISNTAHGVVVVGVNAFSDLRGNDMRQKLTSRAKYAAADFVEIDIKTGKPVKAKTPQLG
jgi:hypothetical protein